MLDSNLRYVSICNNLFQKHHHANLTIDFPMPTGIHINTYLIFLFFSLKNSC